MSGCREKCLFFAYSSTIRCWVGRLSVEIYGTCWYSSVHFAVRRQTRQNSQAKHEATMSTSGSGIQELMAAETRASQIVAEARIGE
jgi:hypothetical protein